MTDRHRLVAGLFVTAQFVLIGVVAFAAWTAGPAGWPLVGWVVALPGVVLGLWGGAVLGPALTASPLPKEGTVLREDGPYRVARHPIYGAVILVTLGAVVWSGSWWAAVSWIALVGLLRWKSGWEERRLSERFPGYAEYAARTPRFLGVPRRH